MAAADASANQPTHQMTEFETRRAELVSQIGDSLEQVLTQINALNRSMESIIEIGNEFASVEALWSQFETVMAADQEQHDITAGHGHGNLQNDEQADKDAS